MLLGGALGNLADRAREGAVIDFIDPVGWPAFNLADVVHRGRRARLLYVVEGPRESDELRERRAAEDAGAAPRRGARRRGRGRRRAPRRSA